MITLTDEQFDEIVLVVAKNNRLLAIKIVKDALGYSLFDSMIYVYKLLEI